MYDFQLVVIRVCSNAMTKNKIEICFEPRPIYGAHVFYACIISICLWHWPHNIPFMYPLNIWPVVCIPFYRPFNDHFVPAIDVISYRPNLPALKYIFHHIKCKVWYYIIHHNHYLPPPPPSTSNANIFAWKQSVSFTLLWDARKNSLRPRTEKEEFDRSWMSKQTSGKNVCRFISIVWHLCQSAQLTLTLTNFTETILR